MIRSKHDSMHIQQQKAIFTISFVLPADSAQKRTMTMIVRTTATRRDPSAIEPSEREHARINGVHTAGRHMKQPRLVVSCGEKYHPPTAPHVVTNEMFIKTN